ncbi:hypothetical protein PV396_41965 [Streptomyces sp. ME02-8801-2C]|uniref:hypothetical protein n=1 Tax=Streptomyces sp. ME02-8801-2C TaxID=3028680 RepID=UPI0029ADC0A0|nr:hypothetical protein [Streptomyces sp. ME02-8801-2C]MDX3458432.1 hypothetical protein [Streptomyces sp. ME02-8801-2C]
MQKAPEELGESGTRLWESVTSVFGLDVHEQLLLLQACRTADLLDRLSAEVAAGGLTVVNQKGDRISNPVVVEQRQQSLVLARMLASVRLPEGESDERPQRRGAARKSYGIRGSVA